MDRTKQCGIAGCLRSSVRQAAIGPATNKIEPRDVPKNHTVASSTKASTIATKKAAIGLVTIKTEPFALPKNDEVAGSTKTNGNAGCSRSSRAQAATVATIKTQPLGVLMNYTVTSSTNASTIAMGKAAIGPATIKTEPFALPKIYGVASSTKTNGSAGCLKSSRAQAVTVATDLPFIELTEIFNGKSETDNFDAAQATAKTRRFTTLVKKRRLSDMMYTKLLSLEDTSGFVTNVDLFECSICFGEVQPNDGIIIRNCLHQFCKECCVQTIEHCETSDIQCPMVEGIQKCSAMFQDREIRSILTAAQLEIYETKMLSFAEGSMENAFHCRRPNCRAWCEIVDKEVKVFICGICSSPNCINCRAIHAGKTCVEYQEEATRDPRTEKYFNELIQKGMAMRCPKCKIILTKTSGCDYLVCFMCKTGICWATKGPRWGPMGAGDYSGGCRCRLNDRRCHPECQNCH